MGLLLASSGTVLVEWSERCGKTTTAKQQANSVISLQDFGMCEKYRASIAVRHSLLLAG